MQMGERLKEERERLNFSQVQFAELVGATRKTLFNWETGVAAPNANVLAAWAAHGMDVLYVVTGQRSQPVPPQALLPEGDRILLDNFHAAPPQVQTGIETTLGAFAPGAGTAAAKRGKAA